MYNFLLYFVVALCAMRAINAYMLPLNTSWRFFKNTSVVFHRESFMLKIFYSWVARAHHRWPILWSELANEVNCVSFSLRRVQRIPFTLISLIYNECTKKIVWGKAVRIAKVVLFFQDELHVQDLRSQSERKMRWGGKASMSSIIWRVRELEIT